jgi:hypothetical protein
MIISGVILLRTALLSVNKLLGIIDSRQKRNRSIVLPKESKNLLRKWCYTYNKSALLLLLGL